MAKQQGPTSLTEALEKLENASQNKVQDFKEILEKDYSELRKTIDELKPHLDSLKTNLKSNVEHELKKTKNQVEEKIKNDPWVTIGFVGLLAFVLGWIFGQRNKD